MEPSTTSKIIITAITMMVLTLLIAIGLLIYTYIVYISNVPDFENISLPSFSPPTIPPLPTVVIHTIKKN